MVCKFHFQRVLRFSMLFLILTTACVSSPSGKGDSENPLLPNRNIGDWAMDGDTVICRNLAELAKQINGGAPYYIDRGAQKVIFQDYKTSNSDIYINLELYQMKTPKMAQDLYNDVYVEAPLHLTDIGENARLAGRLIGVYSIDFYKDTVYGRLTISEKNDHTEKELERFAGSLAGSLFK